MAKSIRNSVIEIIASMGAKVNAEGQYEMTAKQLDNLISEIEANYDSDKCWRLNVCKNKKDETLRGVYDESKKNRFAVIKVVAETKKAKKTRTKKTVVDGERNRKEKGNGYVVIFKMEGKKEQKDTSMTTCAEIKEFIKSLHHKAEKLEMLQIYKMGSDYANDENSIVKTRLSAWK